MTKEGRPRRGSRAFWPKKRAKRIYPRVSRYRRYPQEEKAKALGFAGYKVGMTHVIILDSRKGSPSFGQEIATSVTILECPPIRVIGFRAYVSTAKGLQAAGEAWTSDAPKELSRKLKVGKTNTDERVAAMEKFLDRLASLRLIVATQPRLSGVGKKKPEVFEVEVGGKSAREKFDYAKSMLGKEISAKDVLQEGEIVDAIAVTKGKGFQGVVKRFGIHIQDRHAMKKKRHIGTLGPQTPRRVRPTVPQAGQLGFQTRTELNKHVLKIGERPEDSKQITPDGGFVRYGLVKNGFIIIEGSLPGPKKRLIRLRPALRPVRARVLPVEIREIIKGG